MAERDKQYLQEAKDKGVQFVEDPDIPAFKKAVQPVYDKYGPKFGDVFNEIIAASK